MAIQTEYLGTRKDGVKLYRSYSSEGYIIEYDGVQYTDGVDPESCIRPYIETDIPIGMPAEIEDYKKALREFGVIV